MPRLYDLVLQELEMMNYPQNVLPFRLNKEDPTPSSTKLKYGHWVEVGAEFKAWNWSKKELYTVTRVGADCFWAEADSSPGKEEEFLYSPDLQPHVRETLWARLG